MKELFYVGILNWPLSVKRGVALGRPLLGYGFDTVAVYAQSRSEIAFLEKYGSDLLLELFLLAALPHH